MDLKDLKALPIDESRLDLRASTYRPYFTENNANSVKHIFDTYLSDPRHTLVPASHSGYSVRTLYNRLWSGLKWLSERGLEPEKYKTLKDSISLRQTESGILILPKKTLRDLTSIAVVDDNEKKKWFDKFVEWCGKAKENDLFDSYLFYGGVLSITDDDEKALIKFCAQTNVELDLNKKEGKFKAMR